MIKDSNTTSYQSDQLITNIFHSYQYETCTTRHLAGLVVAPATTLQYTIYALQIGNSLLCIELTGFPLKAARLNGLVRLTEDRINTLDRVNNIGQQ